MYIQQFDMNIKINQPFLYIPHEYDDLRLNKTREYIGLDSLMEQLFLMKNNKRMSGMCTGMEQIQ